jgi:UDP-N-acetylglucosamine diphosphorylase/glucosamine-1-phosphate N-acetyltransferase
MARIVLFEDHGFRAFGPLVYWRTVGELLCGRRTMMDRAAHRLKQPIAGLWTRDWIAAHAAQQCQVPVNAPADGDTVLVNGRWMVKKAAEFKPAPFVGTKDGAVAYVSCDGPLARRLTPAVLLDADRTREMLHGVPQEEVEALLVRYPWDLIARNGEILEDDWMFSSHGIEGTVSSSAVIVNMAQVHIGHGATIKPTAYLDASTGPVHISYNATIEAHATIQGPAYIGPASLVKPNAHLYGGTSIGPCCKVGGEIDATIICAHSNKQHDGFLGHSYLGSWINLGAGTTNSDLKNTYGSIRMRLGGQDLDTGRRLLGAVIGDHTKIGINQSIPTGATIGFGVNVFTSAVVPKYVPSFAWLTDAGLAQADPRRLVETARVVMARRNVELGAEGEKLFLSLPEWAKTLEG